MIVLYLPDSTSGQPQTSDTQETVREKCDLDSCNASQEEGQRNAINVCTCLCKIGYYRNAAAQCSELGKYSRNM